MNDVVVVPPSGGMNIRNFKPKSAKARAVMRVLGAIGLVEAVAAAIDYAEPELVKLYDSMTGSGLEVEKMDQKLGKEKTTQAIIVELARNGIEVSPDVLRAASVAQRSVDAYLSLKEKWSSNFAKASEVDAAQVSVATTAEEDDVERLRYIKSMHEACLLLGLSGVDRFRKLYELSFVFNSIRQSNVNDAEQHERILGPLR